jgi:selenoprotein W-related protein
METVKALIDIEYCTGCRWLTRASWIAQELLITFESELEGVCLRPSSKAGTFKVSVNKQLIWDRSSMGAFPELKVLKQLIRDQVAPKKALGHSDSVVAEDGDLE